MNSKCKRLVQDCIEAYNSFDILGMLKNLDDNIKFENIESDIITLKLEGIKEFEKQALKVKNFFETRKQTITSYNQVENEVIVHIDYEAILAVDFSEDLKAGSELKLKGKSIFTFNENKIVKIQDIS